jgi:hypothetical protein
MKRTLNACWEGSTLIIASLTRSLSMSPFCFRLLIRASLLEPELRHAILAARGCTLLNEIDGPRVKRASFVRSGRVNRVHKTRIKKSFVFVNSDNI